MPVIPTIRNPARRVALIYLAVGSLWILFSDLLVSLLPDRQTRIILHTTKGWFFVCICSALLYYLINRYFRQIEEARHRLADNETRFNEVLRGVNIGVWDWDLHSGIAYLSPTYYEIVGHNPPAVADLDFFLSLVHPADRAATLAAIQAHLDGRTPDSHLDYRIVTASGTIKWIASRGKVVTRDASGKPRRLLGTIVDQSDCKRIEADLQASEARYRAVVEGQTETISRYLPDGTYTFVNDVYCRLFGKTADELIGSPWHPAAYADDLPMIEAKLATMSPDNPVVVIENRVYAANGEIRWMQFFNRGFYDEQGQLRETQAVGRDITERKQAEIALTESNERFSTLFRASPLAIGLSRMDTDQFVEVNAQFLTLFGYSREEVLDHTSIELGLWPDPAARADMVSKLLAQGRVQRFELTNRRKSGEILYLLVSAEIISIQGQSYLLGLLDDISDRKQAEENLRRYARRLVTMDEDLRRKMAAELHDEIGAGLTILGMTLPRLTEHLPAEYRKEGQRCQLKTREVLAGISRSLREMMAGLRPPVLDDFGLVAALHWLCNQLLAHDGVVVELHADPDFPRLDPEKEMALFRITQEAITNIRKHAAATSVTLALNRPGAAITLEVRDNGRGFTIDSDRQRQQASHWGLTIMRERAEAVGGSFSITSAPGQGTTIRVNLEEQG